MSRYLPVCDYIEKKLGHAPLGTGVFVSLGSVLGANYALHSAFNTAASEAWIMSALAGFLLAGGPVEKHVPEILNKNGVGLSRGGRILRGSQLAAVSLPLALSVGLNLTVLADDKADNGNNLPEPPAANHTLILD